MGVIQDFYKSTIGKKIVAALTGAAMLLFLIGHMTGNLKAFAGPEKLDGYAVFLREIGSEMFGHGGVLWMTRLGLLGCLLLHVWTVAQLRARNSAARKTEYARVDYQMASAASTSMWYTGLFLLVYIFYHIAHLTIGTAHPAFEHGAVYQNVYVAFTSPLSLFIYTIGMGAIGFHLYHGAWSLFQTLGLDSPDRNKCLRTFAKFIAIALTIGFLAVPYGVYFGILPKP
jgi:succinate dehydrogenase / fumarate reductase cytochrome b subunit